MKKYCLLIIFIAFGSLIKLQAQPKPSERSFASELQKIKAIQSARNTRIRQSTAQISNGETTVANNISNASPILNSAGSKPAMIKASQKPVKIPAKPGKQ